jgi:CheY-like chemotaxis protein
MRLLLVEDHDDTATALVRLLVQQGYAVNRAAGYGEAKELAAQEGFDLLVCDLMLPDGDGWTLMNELGRRYGMRGIAISASVLEIDHQRNIQAGFLMHLDKPMESQLLLKALRVATAALRFEA